jgi:hypothetical protein
MKETKAKKAFNLYFQECSTVVHSSMMAPPAGDPTSFAAQFDSPLPVRHLIVTPLQ